MGFSGRLDPLFYSRDRWFLRFRRSWSHPDIKKAGKSLNPCSRPWNCPQKKIEEMPTPKNGASINLNPSFVKMFQVSSKEEKPMRFQYVWGQRYEKPNTIPNLFVHC